MKKFLFVLTTIALCLSGCAQNSQTEEVKNAEILDSEKTDAAITETHFNPESEGWTEFKNENITFSYPKEFAIAEKGENIYITSSVASSPLEMLEGEMGINFSPTTKDAGKVDGPSEGVADSKIATNGKGKWYKIELLMGGKGEASTEAKEIFEKVNASFHVL